MNNFEKIEKINIIARLAKVLDEDKNLAFQDIIDLSEELLEELNK